MKYIITLIPILFILLLNSSCSEDFDWVEMTISETGCMNPWDHFDTEKKDKTEIIKEYLSNQGIWVKYITIQKYSDGPFCLSCACPTGFSIIIQIPDYDIEKAKNIGFSIL